MLYTGRGDDGLTKLFSQRIPKSSLIFDALGTIDELNSFLGFCKVKLKKRQKKYAKILEEIQQNLFIIQAEVVGNKMTISGEKLERLEKLINKIEKEMPPIKTFFLAGGTELAALFDLARTVSRRAEREVIKAKEIKIGEKSLAYLNRLSSVLYALARLTNHQAGVKEKPPTYK